MGYGGEKDPREVGPALQKAQAEKSRARKYECPEPEYLHDKSIKRVAEWCNDTFTFASQLLNENPAHFYRLLGWADAESDAEPVAMKYQDAKNKQKDSHKDFAQKTIAGRKR